MDVLRVLAVLLVMQNVYAVLQFTQEPTNQAVLLDQSLWWHCVARASIGSPDPTYTWLFGSQPLLPGAEEERSVFSNGTLYIPRVMQDMLGSYQCRVQSGVQSLTSNVVTLALASLGIVFQTNPVSVTQNLGTSLSLQCSISSIPMATITWQLNGIDVTTAMDIQTTESGSVTLSVLDIAELDHSHGGQYRCLATNRLLTGLTRYSQLGELTLIGRPGFSVTPEPLTVIIGGTATFNCEANGSPSSTIDWLNPQNNVITTSGRFTTTSTRLTITNTQQLDEGYYTCRASNVWGENTATSLLTVSDPSQQIIFMTAPTDQSETLGGRVTFPCSATGNPAPSITWRKEGGDLPADRNQEPALGWLRIVNLQTSDSGFYVCTASNTITTASTRVQLIVQVAPSFIEQLSNVIADSGEEVQFDCLVEGVPTPQIKWTTPLPELGQISPSSGVQFGVQVLSNGSLIIRSAENRHAGVYTCQASNSVSSSSSSASLTVRSPPVITTSPIDQIVIEGEMAIFECRAVATPLPAILWFYNSQQLSTDLQYEVLGNGDLRISNVEKALEGLYTCRAENSFGALEVSAYLTVHVPPQFILHPFDQVVDLGSRVTLDCQAWGDPTPTLQWQKDGSLLVLETNIEVLSNSTIVIDNLTDINTGDYTCIASNTAGTKQVTASLLTPDIPKLITEPSNTTSNESYAAVIPCRSTARETPTILWYLADADGNRGDQIGLGTNAPGTRGQASFISLSGDLEIGKVMKRDEGWYVCVAENSVGSISGLAYLSVNFPPEVTGTNTPVRALEGSSFALLTVGFSGQPTPSVGWTLPNGQPVVEVPSLFSQTIQGDSVFLVVYNPVVADHDGEFLCTISNFLGCANATVQLIVEGAPVLRDVQATPGISDSVTLQCFTKGAPEPTVTWNRDSVSLPDPSVPGHVTSADGTLTITDQAAAETGVYICTATNMYGSAMGTLQVPGQPNAPIMTTVSSVTIEIVWAPPTQLGDLPITAYIVQYQADGSDEYSLGGVTDGYSSGGVANNPSFMIEGLHPYTGYRVRIAGMNGLGTGLFSAPSSVITTLASAPSRPRNVETVATGNFVTVTWREPSSFNGPTGSIVYEVEYYPVGHDMDVSSIMVSHNSNQLEAILQVLEYETDYVVRVRAGNIDLQEWSDFEEYEIRTGVQAPATPLSRFNAVGNGSTSVWLTWKPTNDSTFEAYLISYRTLNSTDMSPDIVLTVQRVSNYVIVGLQRATQYAVSMAYQNAGGLSPFTREIIVMTLSDNQTGAQRSSGTLEGGIIAAIVCGILVVILILALVSFAIYWKRKNDDWTAQPSPFNVDSLWINRRGGSQKGIYDLSMVNEHFVANETGLSSDSAYDLGGGDIPGGGSRSERKGSTAEGRNGMADGEEKKKKKRRWRGLTDVIYKNPDNPGVVLVSKAVIGDTYPAPGPLAVSKEEVFSEDENDVTLPRTLALAEDSTFPSPDSTFNTINTEENPYFEVDGAPLQPDNVQIHGDSPKSHTPNFPIFPNGDSRATHSSNGPSPEFKVFPNANDSVKLAEEFDIDPRLMRKMERRAERDQERKNKNKEKGVERERQKAREMEERKRDSMFGRKRSLPGIAKLFKRRKSDEIPYPELNFARPSERQIENAGMF